MYVASGLIVVGLVGVAVLGAVHAGLWPAVTAALLLIVGMVLWVIAGLAYRRALSSIRARRSAAAIVARGSFYRPIHQQR